MTRRVVVTGAGGFVGGHLARALAMRGWEVTAVSRRDLGAAPVDRLSWQTADLLDPGALPSRFDAVVHCAVDVPAGDTAAEAVYDRNVAMTRNVFDRARDAGASSVVFLSSMSAYGVVTAPEVHEGLAPGSLDPYGRAKRDSEGLLEEACARGLASGLSLRLPGTVGRGSHGNFLSVALRRILAGEAITARNPDALFNNIVYVGDLANFLERWLAGPREGYALSNLGSREPLPMRQVMELLFEHGGRERRLSFETGGKAPFLISLERAVALGYRPETVSASLRSFVADCVA